MTFPPPFYRWRPHPWHGVEPGPLPPQIITAYIEMTPFDTVKYEVDKKTGYLKVDRPQRTSARPPNLYGFIPQTYCGRRVCALSPSATRGDGDPLDVCVLSERPISNADILLDACVIGGLQMVDGGEADDKIVAVLRDDHTMGSVTDISELPAIISERLTHYFQTYKLIPGHVDGGVSIHRVYGHEHAFEVVQAALDDYREEYGV